jgi:hypothetical protein
MAYRRRGAPTEASVESFSTNDAAAAAPAVFTKSRRDSLFDSDIAEVLLYRLEDWLLAFATGSMSSSETREK